MNPCNPTTPNTYIGARYVPIFAGEWENTKTYEPLMIVSNQGNSYTSRTYVPVGVAITNETYWALTGNYNAQIEAYREEVRNYAEAVDSLTTKFNHAHFVNVLDFGAVGDGVTDDTYAFQSAVDTGDDVYVPLDKQQKYLIMGNVSINTNTQRIFSTPFPPEFYVTGGSMIIIKGTTGFTVNSYFNCFENLIFVEDKNPDSPDTRKRTAINCTSSQKAPWNPGGGECTITGCIFDRFLYSIKTEGRAYKINRNEFSQCVNCIITNYTETDGIGLQSPEYGFRSMRIMDNRMHGGINSTFITAESGIMRSPQIINNSMDVGGIFLLLDGGSITDAVIANNAMYNYVNLIINNTVTSPSFAHNVVANNTVVGSYDNHTSLRPAITGTTGCSFEGTVFENNVFGNFNTQIALFPASNYVSFIGNRIFGHRTAQPAFRVLTGVTYEGWIVTGNFMESENPDTYLIGLVGPASSVFNNSTIWGNNVSGTKITNVVTGNGSLIQEKPRQGV